jgi:ketosteroid isomerase-like protein
MPAVDVSEDVSALIDETAEAAAAWMRGDMDRYLDLTHHAAGFTLVAPTGGPATQHADRHSEFRGWTSIFADGEAQLEVAATHAWGDTVVLVMVERQHGRAGDLPDQDLSLRVTHVYRRNGSTWELVHRHADPLVNPLSLERLATLFRG